MKDDWDKEDYLIVVIGFSFLIVMLFISKVFGDL
jgi:hypothetical protein